MFDIQFNEEWDIITYTVMGKKCIYREQSEWVYSFFDVENLNYMWTYYSEGKEILVVVDKKSFPYNWDNYHYKIALLAKRFLDGDKNIIY